MQSNQVVKIKVTKLTSAHHNSQSPKRTDMVSIDSTHMRIALGSQSGTSSGNTDCPNPFFFSSRKLRIFCSISLFLDFWPLVSDGVRDLDTACPTKSHDLNSTVLASTINFANHFQVYRRTQSNLPKHTNYAGQTRSGI